MSISKLTLQNTLALLTLPPYLVVRPLLRLLRIVRPGQTNTWVIGGHSGRLYADNAAALHRHLHAAGRDVIWISADRALSRRLRARGARVLQRNSLRARIAIENARVLAFSHGLTDLDHILPRVLGLRGLKVHLNHCLSHLKAWRSTRYPSKPPGSAGLPFDYLLASSERERANLARSFVGAEANIVVGGGAHLDTFMRARGERAERQITYFPTFRESPAARAALDANVLALASDPRLRAWLETHDYTLNIVGHVNSGTNGSPGGSRVRFVPAQDLTEVLIASELLISDYSGVICDYLALDRATIFFPFDKAEYLATRMLYVDYHDFTFGPEVHGVDALVTLIVSGEFRDRARYESKRRSWEEALFPTLEPIYTRRTEETIRALDASRGSAP